MTDHFEPDSDDQVTARLIAKAWRDPEFKAELLRNPKAIVAREIGVPALPDELEIRVWEEPPHGLYIVLPSPPPDINIDELSDEELVAVTSQLNQKAKPTKGWYCY